MQNFYFLCNRVNQKLNYYYMKKIILLLIAFAFIGLSAQSQTWSTVGVGTNNSVTSMTVNNGNLFTGGQFTTAGGNTANYFAKWNGAIWSSPGGTSMNSSVNALTVQNATVTAGG